MYLVIVSRICKSQGQHPLLLQISLVDSGKTLDENSPAAYIVDYASVDSCYALRDAVHFFCSSDVHSLSHQLA